MAALTLTALIPTIQEAMDIVSREQVGFIPAVSRDSNAERAAIGQQVVSPVVGEMPAEDSTPAAASPDTPAQTINNVMMEITQSRSVPFGITGEENRGLANAGTLGSINRQRIEQAMRTLTNEIEANLAMSHMEASRAYGTDTGLPFNVGDDLTDFSNAMRILDENGAPMTDRQMVLGSSAVNRLRGKMSTLFQVNTAASDAMLRRGSIAAEPVMGLDLHQSLAIGQSPVGAGAGATTDATGYAVGANVITMAAAGAGDLLAGDIISFAGDTNQYLVKKAVADVSAGVTVEIQEPGLKVALPAAATAITVMPTTNRNMFFHRSAIQLATRAPAMPDGGDSADDSLIMTDPVSGLTYEFLVYRQYKQARYEVCIAFGSKVISPRHVGLLVGA